MLKYVWALLMAYLTVYLSDSWHIEYANFFAKFIGFVVVAIVASFGFVVGEKVRDFAMPDFVVTDGRVSSLIKTKLFWVIGLQLGASFVAAVIAALFFFKVFGPSPATYRERYAAEQLAIQEKWKEDHPQEAAQQAREQQRRASEVREMEAAAKVRQARDRLLFDTSSLTVDFAELEMGCSSAFLSNRDGIVETPAIDPQNQGCSAAKAVLEQIRQKGVCKVERETEGGEAWIPCSEVKT